MKEKQEIKVIVVENILEASNMGDGGKDNDNTPWGDITWF